MERFITEKIMLCSNQNQLQGLSQHLEGFMLRVLHWADESGYSLSPWYVDERVLDELRSFQQDLHRRSSRPSFLGIEKFWGNKRDSYTDDDIRRLQYLNERVQVRHRLRTRSDIKNFVSGLFGISQFKLEANSSLTYFLWPEECGAFSANVQLIGGAGYADCIIELMALDPGQQSDTEKLHELINKASAAWKESNEKQY